MSTTLQHGALTLKINNSQIKLQRQLILPVFLADVSATMKAVVLPEGAGNDMMIPEHKVMFLTTESADEAHYVAAVFNSEPVGTVISGSFSSQLAL